MELIPDYGWNVISSSRFLPPWLPHHDGQQVLKLRVKVNSSVLILISSCVHVCACTSIHPCMCIWRSEVATGCPPLLFSALPSDTGSLLSPGTHHGTRLPGQWAVSSHLALHPLPPALSLQAGSFFHGCWRWTRALNFAREALPPSDHLSGPVKLCLSGYFVTTMRKVTSTEHYLEFVKSKQKTLCCLHHADIPFQGQHNFFRHEDPFKYSSFLLYQFINC